jgi:hypothetical protein
VHLILNKTFKVHLDGYNFLPYFKGEAEKSPRLEFFYFSDEPSDFTRELLPLTFRQRSAHDCPPSSQADTHIALLPPESQF